ncbi:hypothetical protein PVL29_002339 [Vitis rotundifolia]|uniref:TIR domain-containing protein n=1 Tax=Vitis rotundifolia TaxID=103349 RepID=A0AA39AIZ7_VITRO|nr:hypothetical protein PVL29_002339 [Vitis rotundifolia]
MAATSSVGGSSSSCSSSMAEKTAAAAAASSTAPSSSSCDWKYGVFLSFRGEDTCNNFTSHLYKALDQKGIDTYMDDKKMRTGEEISPTLVTAIQRSRCSIICLEELVEILECKRTKSQRVVPIFYNVNPSHVRNQTGSFGEALAKHEKNLKIKEGKVRKWREALTQVANLSGLLSLDKPEAQLIEEIVVDISKDLKCVPSKDTQFLVGVDSCIRELESLLCLESTDVLMVGIWAMGGLGKTTLTRAIYEKNFDKFEGCCFLANLAYLRVRKGEDYLKKQLLSSILKDKNVDVTASSLKARLHSKKVLIVLDDVNHQSILEILAGKPNWFGPQSRIIITTRDKHLLDAYGVKVVYEVQKLQDEKVIELFSHYAFKSDSL